MQVHADTEVCEILQDAKRNAHLTVRWLLERVLSKSRSEWETLKVTRLRSSLPVPNLI